MVVNAEIDQAIRDSDLEIRRAASVALVKNIRAEGLLLAIETDISPWGLWSPRPRHLPRKCPTFLSGPGLWSGNVGRLYFPCPAPRCRRARHLLPATGNAVPAPARRCRGVTAPPSFSSLAAIFRAARDVTAEVSVVGGHEVDRAMQVLGVVPLDEARDPGERRLDVCEGARGEGGAVLEGPEEGFRVGVVVADAGTAEGGRDAQRLELGQERGALHRGAVVRMQPEDIITPWIICTNSFDEVRSEFTGFDVVDGPADDAATPDIDDQVQVEVNPTDTAAQIGDVPRVDLVGAGRREGPGAARELLLRGGRAASGRPGVAGRASCCSTGPDWRAGAGERWADPARDS